MTNPSERTPVMSLGLAIFTLVHVIISLVAIVSGFVLLAGFFASRRLDGWTTLFLITTAATSVTGFLFPVHHFMPSHVLGIISLLVLPVAIVARYRHRLASAWRWIYVVASMVVLYLNVFVLVVQAFRKVPPLKALAPTQSEPPFAIAQLTVLVLFIALAALAVIRFRPGATRVGAIQSLADGAVGA
jgi:hypothetical protein